MLKRTENSGDETRINIAAYYIAIGCTEQSWENYAECNSEGNCRMQCQGQREFDIAPCATHQNIDAASVRLRGDSWSGDLKKERDARCANETLTNLGLHQDRRAQSSTVSYRKA